MLNCCGKIVYCRQTFSLAAQFEHWPDDRCAAQTDSGGAQTLQVCREQLSRSKYSQKVGNNGTGHNQSRFHGASNVLKTVSAWRHENLVGGGQCKKAVLCYLFDQPTFENTGKLYFNKKKKLISVRKGLHNNARQTILYFTICGC